MHLQMEMQELGYEFSDLLFYKDTGEISPQVYDVQLYSILKKSVPGQGQQFYEAVMIRGEKIKNQFHKKILGIDKRSSTSTRDLENSP